MEEQQQPGADDLRAREARLQQRETEVARAEARVQAAIGSQKEAIRARERELEQDRERRRELAAEHARRLAALDERERALDRRDATLARWLRDLAATGAGGIDEGTLTEAIATLQAELRLSEAAAREGPAVEDALVERERAVDSRVAAVTARERSLVERVVAHRREEEARRQELDERERRLEERERTAGTAAAAASMPAAAAAPAAGDTDGAWTLAELERLVAAESDRDRAAEWQAYLFHLREFTDASGRLPSEFDALVEDVFGPATRS